MCNPESNYFNNTFRQFWVFVVLLIFGLPMCAGCLMFPKGLKEDPEVMYS